MKQRYWWALLAVAAGMALVLTLLSVNIWPAHAHIPDRPDLDPWMLSLQSKGGYPCCSHVDGSVIPDAEWDTSVVNGEVHYRVRLNGEWIVVTREEVVEGPNKFGAAIAWFYKDTFGMQIRCFMPGGGN